MLSEKVCFEYIWKVSELLGILRHNLSFKQKIKSAIIFILLYAMNIGLTFFTILVSQNNNMHKTGIEFIPFAIGRITELSYFISKSKQVYHFTENWKEIMKETRNIKFFLNGIQSSMRITKFLFFNLIFGILAHAIGVYVTGKTLIPLKTPENDKVAFIFIWIYQSCFQAYGATMFFIFDIFIFHNFFMLKSYAETTSNDLEYYSTKVDYKKILEYQA